jgi:outer membrane protein, heavy metal efflux system
LTNNSLQTAAGRLPNTLMVSQRFPWLGRLRIRGEIADLETRIALTQLAETQLKVIESVKVSYYDLLFNQQALQITVENERLLRDYIKFAEVRYTAGQTSQQDVLRAQVELNKLRDQIIHLNQQLRLARADLAKQIAVSPEANLAAAGPEKIPPAPEQIDQLYRAAIAARPELQGRLDAIQRDERAVELARLEYFPDVTVGVNWGAITVNNALAKTATGNDNWGLMIGVNVPIWHNKLRAGVRESQNRTVESARLYDSARDETFRQIKRLTVQAQALQQQVNLYRKDIIPQAEQTLKVSAADYRVGKVVMLQLIDNWTQLLRFQIQAVRLEATLAQTLASLERAVGMRLTTDSEQKAPVPALPQQLPVEVVNRDRARAAIARPSLLPPSVVPGNRRTLDMRREDR